jgi:phosphate-selective porin OprO/OprP
LSARAEASLLPSRLPDSGSLAFADSIDRRGVEALWIDGPWSVQGEYLASTVSFSNGQPDYRGNGYYGFVSWVATGESRPYSGGNVGNIKPKGKYGALEFALRYSELDLDDRGILGGRERNWTLGANWYLNNYLKLQANYVHVQSERRGLRLDPQVFEVRAQIQF